MSKAAATKRLSMTASPGPSRRIVFIGRFGGSADGWAASLHDVGSKTRVPLAAVYTWHDVVDHAATFDADIWISRQSLRQMVLSGRGPQGLLSPQVRISDSEP